MPSPRPPPAPRTLVNIDTIIGANIRQRRKALNLSQLDLAAAVGISYQQIQKYERADNRVAASVLLRLAEALRCDITDLLAGVSRTNGLATPDPTGAEAAGRAFLGAGGGLEIARLYLAMSTAHRRALLAAARAFGRD